MEVNIKITEGCTCFSYCINDIEWSDLTDKESENYNIEFVDKICEELIKQAQEQYQLPEWIMEYLWDGADTICEQDTFTNLVKHNKHTREKYLGTCDVCNDSIYEWELKISLNNYSI